MTESAHAAQAAAEAAARQSYGKLIAYLAARSRDVAGAEDSLSEAFAAALSEWPLKGVPDNPEAWLLAVARRKAIDAARRQRNAAAGADHLRLIAEEMEAAIENRTAIPDDRLALMFACAHPAIDAEVRAPLILQCVLGFDAGRIASAFLTSPAAMGQRLVRAKVKLRESGIPFRLPERADLPERLDAVLTAIYAAFTEGWSDPGGADARRRELAEEAIWLGRLVAELLPSEAEALGLLALMLHAEARRTARRDLEGEFVPLAGQSHALWNAALIEEAERLLLRASAYNVMGRYQLEAAVQSAHAARRFTGRSDWVAIAQLYAALAALTGSPVVAINHAVAMGEVEGPRAGLTLLDAVAADTRIAEYQPYWAARAALSARLGDTMEADRAYELAIGLESDPALRRFLQKQRARLPNG